MRRIVRRARETGIAIVLAAITGPAAADVITQSRSFLILQSVSEPFDHFFGEAFAGTAARDATLPPFSLFDPGLGTLFSARWLLHDALAGFSLAHSAEVTAPITTPPSFVTEFSMSAHGDVFAQVGGAVLRGAVPSFSFVAGEDAGCQLGPNFVGFPPRATPLPGSPGCTLQTAGEDAAALDVRLIETQNLASMIGMGFFTEEIGASLFWTTRVDVAGVGAPPTFGPGSAEVLGEFHLAGTLELQYEYSPNEQPPVEPPPVSAAPAPATPLVLAAGLLALVAFRRRT